MFRDVRKGMVQADYSIKHRWILALDCIVLAFIIGNHYDSLKSGIIGFFIVMFAFAIRYVEGVLMFICSGLYTYWSFLFISALFGTIIGVLTGIVVFIFALFLHLVVSNYIDDLSDW